jgi:hypothetical protein
MSYRTLELDPIANSGGCARHVVRKEDGSALEVEEGLFILIIVVGFELCRYMFRRIPITTPTNQCRYNYSTIALVSESSIMMPLTPIFL